MDKEKKIQIDVYLRLIVIIICAGLYAWGGIEMKWLRRFLAPSICGFSLLFFTRDLKSLITMPLFMAASVIGYGGTDLTWLKIIKRGYTGLAFGCAASSYNIIRAIKDKENKMWLIIGFTFVFIVSAYILFGVWNPLPSARIEETLLGMLNYTICILTAKRR